MTEFKDFFFKRIINKRNFTYRLILDAFAPYLTDGKRVLDIGCGAGTLSFYIGSHGNYVKGVDISSKAIRACEISAKDLGIGKNVSFQVADFLKINISERFDVILCSEVLEHLVDDRLAAKKIFSNLKNDGVALISVPSKRAPLFRLGLIKGFDRQVGHLRRYTLEELVILLKEQGLRILETRKTQGILRNFLFYNFLGALPLRFANRFWIISDILTFFDNITLRLFGESQIIVVAQKPEEEEK